MIETAEQVVKEMQSDKSAYMDFLEDMAVKHLNNDSELLKSWCDWFNGENDTRPSDFQ